MNLDKAILVWSWEDVPYEYKFSAGGDEDWVARLPISMKDHWIPFLEEGTGFGICSVHKHVLNNYIILVGCHA